MATIKTDYWKEYLKNQLKEFAKETGSKIANKILSIIIRLKNFIQVCPIEMLDKLDNPILSKNLKQIWHEKKKRKILFWI